MFFCLSTCDPDYMVNCIIMVSYDLFRSWLWMYLFTRASISLKKPQKCSPLYQLDSADYISLIIPYLKPLGNIFSISICKKCIGGCTDTATLFIIVYSTQCPTCQCFYWQQTFSLFLFSICAWHQCCYGWCLMFAFVMIYENCISYFVEYDIMNLHQYK